MGHIKMTYPNGSIYDSRAQNLPTEDATYAGMLDAFIAKYPSEQANELREAAMRRLERETQEREMKRLK